MNDHAQGAMYKPENSSKLRLPSTLRLKYPTHFPSNTKQPLVMVPWRNQRQPNRQPMFTSKPWDVDNRDMQCLKR